MIELVLRIIRAIMRILYRPKKTTPIEEIHYGYLYNYYAYDDSRNIANTGWHTPTKTEFETLATYLGGSNLGFGEWDVAGGPLKEVGLVYWNTPNVGATNAAKFNGRGGGARRASGLFESMNVRGFFRIPYTGSQYVSSELRLDTDHLFINYILDNSPNQGTSIRLIKDSTTLSDGEEGTYVGNDGTVYRTICIGTQEWLADNLVEVNYRNGDPIPNVTDNTAWAGLSTGAWCVYDNNPIYK